MIPSKTVDLDYFRLLRASKRLDPAQCSQKVRIGLLSDAATQQFSPLIRTLLHENRVAAEIYEGAFDATELEVYNPASALYEFKPDVIVILNSSQSFSGKFYHRSGSESDFLESALDTSQRIWDAISSTSRSRVIQCNIALPYERQFGNFDLKVRESLYAVALAFNTRIVEAARQRKNVLLCDVESIASWVGRSHWFDERLWNMSKTFCALEQLPLVAQSLVDIILATMGRVVKCVVLDLDNTLWGGVVGDDGHLGVAIGAHGDGEAFYHFQHYLLSLKRRGILLAVCSKNDFEKAVQPFLENPEMVLKRDDITVFVANWSNKADNIRTIRDTLEIGFDSMVFLDDNPFERNLVREFLPDVIVPELPEEASEYIRAISALNLFETTSFSEEDVARSQLYKQEAGRREMRSAFTNIEEYLQSLEMVVEVNRFSPGRIGRIAQLIQRSNQFNLTTHRYSEAECERLMLNEEEYLPLSASLSDRFGDHGLISLVVARFLPEELELTDWLMSCRVLQRGVEHFMMSRIVTAARDRGLRAIRGEYIPTPKNAMVKDFYAQFGFEKTASQNGRTEWRLETASYKPQAVYITEMQMAVA